MSRKPKTPWAKEQPRDGETILHCGHLDDGIKHHWLMDPEYVEFRRPDGTKGRARWIVQCPACFAAFPEHGPTVNGDDTWVGDEPAIKDLRGT